MKRLLVYGSSRAGCGSGGDTLCPYVFDAAYIARDGEVYSCPHQFPHARSYGNIRERSLDAILRDSSELAALREDSARGRLACFEPCNLLPYDLKHDAARRLQPAENASGLLVQKLKLTVGWYCNASCVMCPQDHRERTQLDIATLTANVPWPRIGEIIVEGGEPLAIKLCHQLWDHLVSIGRAMNLVTNGLLITPAIADRIAAHSRFVYVSINAVTRDTYARVMRVDGWERLLTSLGRLRDAKQRHGDRLKIIGHFTATAENLHELPAFIALADREGLDIVNWGYNRLETVGLDIERMLADDDRTRLHLRGRVLDALARKRASLYVDPSRLEYLGLLHRDDGFRRDVDAPSGN